MTLEKTAPWPTERLLIISTTSSSDRIAYSFQSIVDELDEEPHEILEISPDASDDVVTAVARRKSANVHPDSDDPDREEYARIQKAKDAMLDDD